MADIAGAVVGAVACVAQCLSPQGEHQINRWRGFKRSFKILKTEVKKLKAERTGLQRRVNLAKKNGDGIEENVQNWLERAEEIEVEIQKWLEKACMLTGDDMEAVKIRNDDETAAATEATEEIGGDAEIAVAAAAREIREGEETVAAAAGEIGADEEKKAAKRRCFKWFCRNLKSRYQLSKEAETLLEDVVKHLKDKKFDKISHPVILKDPRLSSKDYEAFESRTSTLKNVISSLSDPNVNIVGIYGMGGIGKTTLAKEVAKQPEASKLFDSVIFVEVTVKPHIIKIQEEIAHKLPGLTFSHKEIESTRATELYQRLEKEKNILIILDNIWAEINLEAIGIPLGDGRKLLLTARSSDVLVKMESQRNFPVQFLNDEEAWQLFKKMSRDDIEGTEFEPVAREVVKKCALLPIVVVTIAKALRNKELFAWRNASQQMGLSFSADIQHIHASMKLSFDYLETENLKKTILLIGYANITSIDKLLMYGMGVALFEDVNRMERRRDRVLTLVQELKDSCLLLDSNTTGEDFSMHDVVHEVAMSIASSDPQVFTKLQSLDKNALKVCRSIVLKDVKTGDLPQVLQCQQLKLLSISGVGTSSLKLPDEFFIRMTELKVLVLVDVDLRSLFPSLRCLTNLQALGLFDCRLDDIAIIGNFKKLEILSLKNSDFERLPEEVGHLNLLKSLDLTGCYSLDVIAPNVLSSLSHLEELYMSDFSKWEEEGLNKDRENVSLDELKNLSNLTCLEIEIEDAKTLPRDLFFNKLERYKISIGPDMRSLYRLYKHGLGMRESCRNFNLSVINTDICLNDGHIMQLKKIEDLCLFGSQDMKSVLYGLDRDGFQHLKYLEVGENCNLWCIVDSMKYATSNAFPVLESLLIYNLINLEKICHGRLTTQSSFSQLRRIDVEGCAKLENIFSFSIARRLQLLQSIDVSRCENMKEIFAIEREDESNCNISEVIDTIEFSQLRSLHLRDLPPLNTIFNGKVALPRLEELVLIECNNLKCLFSSSTIGSFDRLPYLQIWDCETLEEIMIIDDEDGLRKVERQNNVPNLKMMVRGCHKLKTLFFWNTYKKFFLRLELLSVFECELLEVIFDLKGLDFENKHNAVVITQLSELNIGGLPKLKQVWNNDPKISVSFEKLEEVRIVGCEVLKNVFPASVASSLSQLKSLDISKCGVEKIVFVVEEEAETSSRFVLPKVALPNLEKLVLINCNNLKCVFSSSTIGSFDRLQYLQIKDCQTLEEIMVINDEDGLRKEERHNNVPNLTMMVLGCHKLKTLFSRTTYKKFLRLESLSISNCDLLEVIFDLKGPDFENKHNAIVITQLSKLEIVCLPKLKQVWNNDPKISVSFEKLEEVRIVGCEVLKNVLPASIASSLSRLKSLHISESGVEEIVFVVEEEAETSSGFILPKVALPNLEKLILSDCNNLKCLFSSSTIGSFDRFQYLDIKDCQTLEEIMVINDEDGLRKEERKNNVPNLKMMVRGCHKLKTLFSWNTYKKFLRLESLSVFNCDLLEVIFNLKGPDFENKHNAVVITQLSELNIGGLPKLKQVWNNDPKISVSFEKLEEVRIVGCKVLKNVFPASVASSLSQLKSLDISKCGVEEIVFIVEEEAETSSRFVFPKLISLTLHDLPNFTTFFSERYIKERRSSFLVEKIFQNLERLAVQGKILEDLFCKLHCLEVSLDKSSGISSLDFLQRFHSIKWIEILGDYSRYFRSVSSTMSARISDLNKCSDLKHILKEESNMDHWIHLEVKYCDNLVNPLIPSSTSLRNLSTLVVSKCNRLTNIVTSSTARSMGQLREMQITGCFMMTELVLADEGDEANDNEIVFSELKKLVLQDLGCLTSFWSANYTLEFPSLEEILVEKCSEMKSFTKGNLRTPKLQNVKHRRNMQVEECWKGNLNTTIEELYKRNLMICNEDEEVNREDDDEEDVSGSDDEEVNTEDDNGDDEEVNTEDNNGDDVSDSDD